MDCEVFYDGRCHGGIGDSPWVRNNSTSGRRRATVEIRQNGSHFRTDTYDLDAGERAPINSCSIIGSDHFSHAIVGCTPI